MDQANQIEQSDVDVRWRSAFMEIRNWTAKDTKIRKISPDKAIWLIESIRIFEFNSGRRSSIDDLAKQMGETYSAVAPKVVALEKNNIIKRITYEGKAHIDPSPELPGVVSIPVRSRTKAGIELEVMSIFDGGHKKSLRESVSSENDTNAGNPIAQETIFAHGGSMKSAVDMYRAMRDEIWSRMGEGSTKRARTLLMIQIMDVLAASGGENEWVPIAKIAEASGGSLALVSRFTSDLQRQKFLERTERVVVDGERYPTVLARMNREFLGAVLQRASSYSSSPVSKGSQQSDNSSNAPST